jgi:hypothetical protein
VNIARKLPPEVEKALGNERCLSLGPVFDLLGINKDSGYALLDSGELPFVYVNKTRKVQLGALLAFLRNAKQKGASAPGSRSRSGGDEVTA